MLQLRALEKDIADGGIGPNEDLLKRHKTNSLFSSRSGAMFDPILQEYVLPGTSMLELKALKDDIINKHQLFTEMKIRMKHNLENYEVLCDPLVHSYRMTDLLFKGKSPTTTTANVKSTHVAPRKLYQGDDLLKATTTRRLEANAKPVLSKYRKLNKGDDLFKATMCKVTATSE